MVTRVLCLHGYGENANIFRKRVSNYSCGACSQSQLANLLTRPFNLGHNLFDGTGINNGD
ncbi:hypothetical protein DL93DRAFT_2088242 [Clavulina sp. PMI_390]|nr:hypothetical protein DL93DRAFT_2088242 [Clavulina sp. PMI_390]